MVHSKDSLPLTHGIVCIRDRARWRSQDVRRGNTRIAGRELFSSRRGRFALCSVITAPVSRPRSRSCPRCCGPPLAKQLWPGTTSSDDPAQVRASIGSIGQLAALDWQLTGRENLVLFGRLRGMRRKHARLRADALIHQFDMSHAADRRVRHLFGWHAAPHRYRRRTDGSAESAFPRRADNRVGPA